VSNTAIVPERKEQWRFALQAQVGPSNKFIINFTDIHVSTASSYHHLQSSSEIILMDGTLNLRIIYVAYFVSKIQLKGGPMRCSRERHPSFHYIFPMINYCSVIQPPIKGASVDETSDHPTRHNYYPSSSDLFS
jgi:hypothetical protein